MCFLSNVSFLFYFIFVFVEDPIHFFVTKKKSPPSDSSEHEFPEKDSSKLPPMSTMEIAKMALIFFAIYLASNYFGTKSFENNSLGSATIVASTSAVFTLLFGYVAGVDVISVLRVLALLVSVGGVTILGISSFSATENNWTRNLFGLFGAMLYGVFSTFIKRKAIDESRITMPLLFGFSGLFTLLLTWPMFFILDYFRVEELQMPSPAIARMILFNVVFGGLLPNYLWNVAYVCTSPLVVAIGLSFGIPLALLIDWYRKEEITQARIYAALCVITGFILVNLSSIYPAWDMSAERLLFVRTGLMREEQVVSTEERAAKLHDRLVASKLARSSRT